MRRLVLLAVVCTVAALGRANAAQLSSLDAAGASIVPTVAATDGIRLGPIRTIAAIESFSELRADESAVVWTTDSGPGGPWIQGYDFQREELVVIRPGQHNRRHCLPDISGRTVVWSEDLYTHREIYSYDLDTRQVTPLITGEGIFRGISRISDDALVWAQKPDSGRGKSDVWGARGPNWEPFPIDVSSTVYSGYPDVDGDRVSYVRAGQLIVSDLDSGVLEFTAPVDNGYSQIAGDHVAWETKRTSEPPGALVHVNHEIANLVTGQRWTLEGVDALVLGDGFAVYHDYDANPETLVAFDLNDGSETILRTIETDRYSYRSLALAGDRLIWMESGNQILAANIIVPEPGTLALLAVGMVGLLLRFYRCRKAPSP